MIADVLTGDVNKVAADFILNILNSDVDYHIALRKLHKCLDIAFKDEEVVNMAKKQIGEGFEKYGCSAYIRSNTSTDYSEVDHIELTHIEKAMKVLAGRQKAILKMLKEIDEGEEIKTTINGYPALVENQLEKPALIKITGPKRIKKPSSPVFSFPTKK